VLKGEGITPNGLIVPDDEAPITEPEPGLKRQVLAHSPAMMLVRHQMRQGWCGSAHAHPHEQLVYIVSGRIRITVDGVSRDVDSGGSFVVASNIQHQAAALEDSVVLDVFTPKREDYLSGR
jgi:quercetin dioxygenase-like cupin family protein